MGKTEERSHLPERGRFLAGLTRRTFLKLSGFAALAAAVFRFGRHLPALGNSTPLLPEGADTMTETWLPTSCLNCATRCAIRVRVVNGRAVKIAGNPLSRVTEGANCPRAHIGLQVLYDPGRIATPLRRTNPAKGKGIDPAWKAISWEEALTEIGNRLKALRGDFRAPGQPHRLLLFRGLNTVSDEDYLRRFAEAYGTPNLIASDGLGNEADKIGQWLADGNYTQSAYDLPGTNYILAFGASILESQKPLARNLRMWGKIHRERPNRVKVVVIDPRQSITAAKADRWLPINPGTDGALAMSIAAVIISEKLYDADFVDNHTAGFEEYARLATTQYAPETATVITGIPAETIREIAREFAAARPAIAWRGRGATGWPGGAYASYAIFCLNALVGSIDVPGGVLYQQEPPLAEMIPRDFYDDIAKSGNAQPSIDLSRTTRFPTARTVTNQVADSITGGSPYPIEIAIGFNGNFVMTEPGAPRWHEALSKLPFYVHVAPFVSEMATYADIVLPAPTFLEQWGYDCSPPGSGFAEVRLKQPVVARMPGTMDIIEIIYRLAQGLGGAVAESFHGTGGSAEDFVRFRTAPLMPWPEFREKAVWTGPAYRYYGYDEIFRTPSGRFEFSSGNLAAALSAAGEKADGNALLPHYEKAPFLGDRTRYPLLLSVYQPVMDVENGSQNYPWAQELYLVRHGQGWQNFAEMNRATTAEMGIRDGDMVWVESPFGKLRVKARVFEGIRPGVVSIARGQGHDAYGKWDRGIGVNPNEIIGVDYDRLSGQSAFYNTRVRVYPA
ncbi:MAG: molybdopterin-dependent oxidoreductase [Chloroflexota bacterium]